MKDDFKNKTEEIQLIRSVHDETEEVVSNAKKKKKNFKRQMQAMTS